MRYIKKFESWNDDLIDSIERIDVEGVKNAIKNGAYLDVVDSKGRTPLNYLTQWSIDKKLTLIAKILIDAGADINSQDNNGCTPLYWAAYHGNYDLVKLLIESGCHIDIPSKGGQTPLFQSFRNMKVMELLINSGAYWNSFCVFEDGRELDFIDFLKSVVNYDKYKYIVQKYPEKYKEYLGVKEMMKDTKKYNL